MKYVNQYQPAGFKGDYFDLNINELQQTYGAPGSGLTEPYIFTNELKRADDFPNVEFDPLSGQFFNTLTVKNT